VSWLEFPPDSGGAEYFQDSISSGNHRFLEPAVAWFSICLGKLRASEHNANCVRSLCPSFSKENKILKNDRAFFANFA
jgi:hypothetical protein